MNTNIDIKETARWMERMVNILSDQNETSTNAQMHLDDKYSLYIGWSEGFGDEPRTDAIQNKNNPDWALVAAVKLRDDGPYWADLDAINFELVPGKDGEVFDISLSLEPGENYDYEATAEWLIGEYEDMCETMEKAATERGEER